MRDSEHRFTKGDGFVTRNIAGETIIVPIRGGVGDLDSIFTLNGLGTMVWGLIDRGLTVGQMADEIAREHEVAREEASQDLIDFLGSLERSGLIRPALGCSP